MNWLKQKWNALKTKVLAWCRNSATLAWARFCMIAGALAETTAQYADVLASTLPAVAPFLPPRWLGLVTLLISLVTEAARRRTLKTG
jgi:hypothetical protein